MHTTKTAIALAVSLATIGMSHFSIAQQSQQIQNTSSVIQVVELDIPASNLADAITRLSAQTGVQIVVPTDLVRGVSSPAVNGRFSAEEALQQLTQNTGLSVQMSSNNALTLTQGSLGGDKPEPDLETLVIYGTKQNLTLQETQASVELFDAERIDREVLFSLVDILLRTANVSSDNVQSGFSIRGVGQGGVGFAGTGRTANVYVDGLPLTSNAEQGANSLWDVGQVEVLRGPQSTIQGRNALAGAIIISTNDPTYEWEFKGRAQVATADTSKASFVASGPIIDNQLAFRLAYDYQDYDSGLVEATTGIAQEFEESHTLRGKLLFEPESVEGLRIELTAEYVETDFGEFNTVFAPVPFDDPAFSEFDPFGGETFTRVRLENPETTKVLLDVQYELNEHWTLIGLGTWEDNERNREFGLPANGEVLLSPSPAFDETYTAELRAAFEYDIMRGWIGAYYFDTDQESVSNFLFPVTAFGVQPDPIDSLLQISTLRNITTENYAIFGDVTFELNEHWSVNIGARYDSEEFGDTGGQGSVTSTPETCTVDLGTGPFPCNLLFPANNTPGAPATFEAFLPRASIIYDFDDDQSLSFSVQRGYRAGGATVRSIFAENIIEVVEFDPEYITNYEIAYRSQWLEDKLTFNANAFYTDWTDQQVSISGESGSAVGTDSFIDNVGSSELYGLELSLFAEVYEGLDLFATLGLLETEFTDFPFATSADAAGNPFENLKGNEFSIAPSVTASLGASYAHDSGWYGSVTTNYRGAQKSDVTNLAVNEVGSYTLVNGRVGYEFEHINLYVFANNLFDRRFITRKEFQNVSAADGSLVTLANARFQINDERIAGIAVEFAY